MEPQHFIFYRLITEMYCVEANSQSEAQSKLFCADDLEDFSCAQFYKEPSEMVFMDKCRSDICPKRRTSIVACRQD